MIAVEYAADSDTGRRRKNNEDSFALVPELGLFMVADGIGGRAFGEVASRMAVDIVRECFEANDPDDTWPYGVDLTTDRDHARLILSIRRANKEIFMTGQRDFSSSTLGTTFAGVLVAPSATYIAHVGDSRVYRYRDGQLARLTRDHSLLEEIAWHIEWLKDVEELDGDIAHVITRALGIDEQVQIDSQVELSQPGDILLVCSDGLWGPVCDDQIASILSTRSSLQEASKALIDEANWHGGPDNVTCVLVRLNDGQRSHCDTDLP